jgi:hypothetical protein
MSEFIVRNNRVARTLADTIHVTGGSVAAIVTGNVCSLGGDDGIAVVRGEGNKLSAVNRKSGQGTHGCITVVGLAGVGRGTGGRFRTKTTPST